jgi:drug/metabolite transporter (DMT)-like permease
MWGTLLTGILNLEPSLFVRRARNAAIVYLLALAALLCGIGFLIGAGYTHAAEHYGSFRASLGFGVGFVILAVLIFGVYQIASAVLERRRAREKRAQQVSSLLAAALALLPTLLRSRAGLAEILAPVVALIAYMIYKENSGKPDGEDGSDT